ncbi:MAG TPA: glutamine--tRNA ligase, partial [Thermoanaerobaculia bacterium]|nr:glutamine--tRNA ligase [Thermoanaerobaculia bacterium]
LVVRTGCRVEPSLVSAKTGDFFQFERVGYFTVDPSGSPSGLVFNRSVSLRDTWGKIEKRARGGA